MKKGFLMLIAAFMVLSLTGCNRGISEEEYNRVCEERNTLQEKVQELQSRIQPEDTEKVKVKVGGDLTVMVRALMPDHITDFTTPKAAAVTFFQGFPFVLYTKDLTEQLEVGECYTFEVEEEIWEMTRKEYECLSHMEMLSLCELSGFRKAEEGEYGVVSEHLVFELLDEK